MSGRAIVIISSMPMDFICAAALGGILPPLMSARLNSKRCLPVSKEILPGMVTGLPDWSVTCISSPAEKAWLEPNSLLMARPDAVRPGRRIGNTPEAVPANNGKECGEIFFHGLVLLVQIKWTSLPARQAERVHSMPFTPSRQSRTRFKSL